MFRRIALTAFALASLATAPALAETFTPAETLKQGRGTLDTAISFDRSDNIFNAGSDRRNSAREDLFQIELRGEYGMTDWLTLGFKPTWLHMSEDGAGRTSGLGDADFYGRLRLWQQGNATLSLQGTLIAPLGYDRDDNPALGDGRWGVEPRLMYGVHGNFANGWGWELGLQGAWRHKFDGPADEMRVDARAAVKPLEDWTFALVSFNTIGLENEDSRNDSDYDRHRLQLEATYDITPRVYVGGALYSDIAGRNVRDTNGVMLMSGVRF